MAPKIERTPEQWKQELTPEQYHVMFEKGTEAPFTGKYYKVDDEGVYHCGACGTALFDSSVKYDSGSGWPSFWQPVADGVVEEHVDTSAGMTRVEITCANCGGHLGHKFPDGPKDQTGERYCINSCALELDTRK